MAAATHSIQSLMYVVQMIVNFAFLGLVSFTFWIVNIPFMFFIWFVNWIQKLAVNYLQKDIKITHLKSMDVPFMFEKQSNIMITALAIFKGQINIKTLKRVISKKIFETDNPSFLRLRRKIVQKFGLCFAVDDDNFKIGNHVRVINKKQRPSTEKDLRKIFMERLEVVLPTNISPWEIVLIKMEERCNEFALIIRLHHALTDGYGATVFIKKILDCADEIKLLKLRPCPSKTTWQKVKMALEITLKGPFYLLSFVLPKINSPIERKEATNIKCVSWSPEIKVEEVKQVAKRTGSTVTGLLLGCLAGAMRNYVNNHNGNSNVKNLHTIVSVNNRTLEDTDTPLENDSSCYFCNLPIEAETVKMRHLAAKSETNIIKNTAAWQILRIYFENVLSCVPVQLGIQMMSMFKYQASLVFGNIPGPTNKVYLNGNVLKKVITFGPLLNNASCLNVTAFSYNGSIHVSVLTDKALASNPDIITDSFYKEFRKLHKDVLN